MHKAARPVCSCEEVPLPAGWERHRFCLDERNYRRGTIASLKRSQSTITPMRPKRAQQQPVFSPYADMPLEDVINFTDFRINSRQASMLSLIRIESPDRASDNSCSEMINSDIESPNLEVPAMKLEKLRRVRSPLKRSRNISPDKCSTE